MEKDGKKKKKRIFEKVLMGAIIGGAIGSVVGVSIAPKKGSETREDLVKAGNKTKGVFRRVLKFIINRKNKNAYKEIPHE